MRSMFRFTLAIITGIVVALILLIAVEMFSAVVHPFPEDFDGSPTQMCAHVARYPAWVLAVVVPMWSFAAGLSTWISGIIGGRGAAMVIGLLWIAAVLLNISMLPYPIWFKCSSVITIVLAAFIATRKTVTAAKTDLQELCS